MTGLLTSQRERNVAAYLIGLLVSISLALVVVLVALDVQSERVLDSDGLSWSLAALFGPAVFLGQSEQGWAVVRPTGSLLNRARFVGLFHAHIVLDYLFIAAYAVLGLVIVLFVKRTWWRILAGAGLTTLIAVDVLENSWALAVFRGTAELTPAVVALTMIKWLVVAALVIIVVLGLAIRTPEKSKSMAAEQPEVSGRSPLGRAWNAVLVQRFSLLPSLVFFVLSVMSGAAILEQLPDVERAWVDSGIGRFRAAAAFGATLLVTASVFMTTRLRIGFAQRFREAGQTYDSARLRYWAIGPAVVGVIAVAALLVGRTGATWPDFFVSAAGILRRAAYAAVRGIRWRAAPGDHRCFAAAPRGLGESPETVSGR